MPPDIPSIFVFVHMLCCFYCCYYCRHVVGVLGHACNTQLRDKIDTTAEHSKSAAYKTNTAAETTAATRTTTKVAATTTHTQNSKQYEKCEEICEINHAHEAAKIFYCKSNHNNNNNTYWPQRPAVNLMPNTLSGCSNDGRPKSHTCTYSYTTGARGHQNGHATI